MNTAIITAGSKNVLKFIRPGKLLSSSINGLKHFKAVKTKSKMEAITRSAPQILLRDK